MTNEGTLDVSLVLDRSWPVDGFGPVSKVIAQLPEPTSLPAGTRIVVYARGKRGPGIVSRLFGPRRKAHVAVRCSALLARGYREIGAANDVAWGVAP
jgi:hypothetical protein